MRVSAGLSWLVLGASLLSTAPSALARDGLSTGAAVALGAIGGLAIGGAIGSAAASGPYYPGKQVGFAPPPSPPPVYYAPRRVRVYEEVIEPRCYVKRRRFIDEFGDIVIRRERWCD
jgi:hypothetical protein